MNIINSCSIIDTKGEGIPCVEIIEVSGCYCVDNLANGDEIVVKTLWEAEAVASAMRNRNQANYDKYSS